MKNDATNRQQQSHAGPAKGAEKTPQKPEAPGQMPAAQPKEVPVWRPGVDRPPSGELPPPARPEIPSMPGIREIPEKPAQPTEHRQSRIDRERAEDEGMIAPPPASKEGQES